MTEALSSGNKRNRATIAMWLALDLNVEYQVKNSHLFVLCRPVLHHDVWIRCLLEGRFSGYVFRLAP